MLSYRGCVLLILCFCDLKANLCVALSYGHSEGSPSEKGTSGVLGLHCNGTHSPRRHTHGLAGSSRLRYFTPRTGKDTNRAFQEDKLRLVLHSK